MNKSKPTETLDIDLALAQEFEYRKRKLELIEEGRQSLERIESALEGESDPENLREAAVTFARHGINLAIENVDNAIAALTSVRKYNTAMNAMKFLLVILVLSNVLVGVLMWLILR